MTCKCFARCEADCVCDHDWTPPAVIALRAEIERLRAELAEALEAVRDCASALRYIAETYGKLYGVGWDRALAKADAAMAELEESK